MVGQILKKSHAITVSMLTNYISVMSLSGIQFTNTQTLYEIFFMRYTSILIFTAMQVKFPLVFFVSIMSAIDPTHFIFLNLVALTTVCLTIIFFFCGATVLLGSRLPHYRGFANILRHTTLGRTPLDEGSAVTETST